MPTQRHCRRFELNTSLVPGHLGREKHFSPPTQPGYQARLSNVEAGSGDEIKLLVDTMQVLDLLHLPKEGVGRQFLRVAVATISTMLSLQKLLTIKYIIQPLTRPLDQLCGGKRQRMFLICSSNCHCGSSM